MLSAGENGDRIWIIRIIIFVYRKNPALSAYVRSVIVHLRLNRLQCPLILPYPKQPGKCP